MIRMIPKTILLGATAHYACRRSILLNQSGLTDISAYAGDNGKDKNKDKGNSDKSDKAEKSSNKSSEKSRPPRR